MRTLICTMASRGHGTLRLAQAFTDICGDTMETLGYSMWWDLEPHELPVGGFFYG